MIDIRPLLLFDSGIGGLSVLDPVRAMLPTAPIVYAADYAFLPYGARTEAEIGARVPALLGRLVERYRPRLAIIACNTASTIALAGVRAALNLPIVGTVPAIKPAAALTRTGAIGLLGTAATVRQAYVDRLDGDFVGAGQRLYRQAANALVPLAEARLRGETIAPADVAAAVRPLFDQPGAGRIDTIVLACTHFPLLKPELARAIGKPVTFVDGGEGIARRVAALTAGQGWPDRADDGLFVTTGPLDALVPYHAALAVRGLTRHASL